MFHVGGSANDDAWVKVPLWGLLGYVVVLAVVIALSDASPVTLAGQLLVPTVIATGLVVIVATSSRRRWGWKGYAASAPLAVGVLTVALALVTSVDPAHDTSVPTATPLPVDDVGAPSPVAADASQTPSADATPDPTPDPTSYPTFTAHLTAPDGGANWLRATDAQTLSEDTTLAQWTAGLYGIEDVVSGSYSHKLVPQAPFRYVGVNGHIPADSREAAGRAALVSTIGNRVATFPPRADGWLGCNGGTAQGTTKISCAWVGDQAAVFLRWEDTDIKLGQAASMTRAFRDFASKS